MSNEYEIVFSGYTPPKVSSEHKKRINSWLEAVEKAKFSYEFFDRTPDVQYVHKDLYGDYKIFFNPNENYSCRINDGSCYAGFISPTKDGSMCYINLLDCYSPYWVRKYWQYSSRRPSESSCESPSGFNIDDNSNSFWFSDVEILRKALRDLVLLQGMNDNPKKSVQSNVKNFGANCKLQLVDGNNIPIDFCKVEIVRRGNNIEVFILKNNLNLKEISRMFCTPKPKVKIFSKRDPSCHPFVERCKDVKLYTRKSTSNKENRIL